MLDKLKKIYPSLISYNQQNDNEYCWFINVNNKIFGIGYHELNERDIQLLSTFFQPFEPSIPLLNYAETLWYKRIFEKKSFEPKHPFRFIYFNVPNKQIATAGLQESLHTLFKKDYSILWSSISDGILIEQISLTEEAIQFEHIINILRSDLAVDIRFFIGPIQYEGLQIKETFERTISLGKKIFSLSNKDVLHHVEVTPYLLLSQIPKQERLELSTSILKGFYTDSEMLETLHNYFASNLNISETAKSMYMHRNSIQYRIDKFIRRTNIDVRSFNEAVSVKIAMIAKTIL